MADALPGAGVAGASEGLAPVAPALVTRDYLWRGRLCFVQPAKRQGYRFNLDPVLLAGFAQGAPLGHVMDFGAGCGIVGILLLKQNKARRVTAVEVQPELAALIVQNAQANGLGDRLEVLTGDLRQLVLPKVDAVVFNPPYYPSHSFRPCHNLGRDQGRREQNGTLADFVARAFAALDPQSNSPVVSAIAPVSRYLELRGYIERCGGRVVRAQEVWPRQEGPAVHVLVSAVPEGHGRRQMAGAASAAQLPFGHAQLSAPLILHEGQGRRYTPQINAWVEGPQVVPA